jgi:hypothetical protein
MMDGDHKIAFDFAIFPLQFQDQRAYGSSSSALKVYRSVV